MRSKLLRSGSGGINWGAPKSVVAWSEDPNDYTLSTEFGTPESENILVGPAPDSGRPNTVYVTGHVENDAGDAFVQIQCNWPVTSDDLVLAGARTYNVVGTFELKAAPVTPVDPTGWGFELVCYRGKDFTSMIERFPILLLGPPANANDVLRVDVDTDIVMPTGTNSMNVRTLFNSSNDNATPGPRLYNYDVVITLLDP